MNLLDVFRNPVLLTGVIAWTIASLLKLPVEYLLHHRWNWALVISTGGMPSTHSALMAGTTVALGLFEGFDSPVFALGVAISMVVLYDAAGVRRQAGIHASRINMLVQEIFQGKPIPAGELSEELKEMLGHSPAEVAVGTLLGVATAFVFWLIWM
jgi:acid phosphatase family membrane protein YuiD